MGISKIKTTKFVKMFFVWEILNNFKASVSQFISNCFYDRKNMKSL